MMDTAQSEQFLNEWIDKTGSEHWSDLHHCVKMMLCHVEALSAENKRLRGIVVNYVDPFDITPEDEAFVEGIQRAALGDTDYGDMTKEDYEAIYGWGGQG